MRSWNRWSGFRRALLAAVLTNAAALLASVAVADDPLERDEAAAKDPGTQPSLPPITVEARRELAQRVARYVNALTHGTTHEEPLQVWRTPLCPAVAGLPRADGQTVFDRFTRVARSLGLTLGGEGCHPNFAILVTSDPDGVLADASQRKPRVFGDGAGLKKFRDTPRPVRIWYNAELHAADGQSPMGAMHLNGAPTFLIRGSYSKFTYTVQRDLVSVVIVVDRRRLGGLDWRQVTDYVALAGLTHTDLDADYGDAPTILRLFTHPVPDLMGMSEWDRQFLKDVYAARSTSRGQRVDLKARLVRDLGH